MCAWHQKCLTVVVVRHVVGVAVHRPVKIFFETMGMAVIGDHLQMVLYRLEDGRRVGHGGHDGPYDQRQA